MPSGKANLGKSKGKKGARQPGHGKGKGSLPPQMQSGDKERCKPSLLERITAILTKAKNDAWNDAARSGNARPAPASEVVHSVTRDQVPSAQGKGASFFQG